jgi:uncharacterized protein YukE
MWESEQRYKVQEILADLEARIEAYLDEWRGLTFRRAFDESAVQDEPRPGATGQEKRR